jgi:hypothetical protein
MLGGCEGEEANHSLPMYAFKKFFKDKSRKKIRWKQTCTWVLHLLHAILEGTSRLCCDVKDHQTKSPHVRENPKKKRA